MSVGTTIDVPASLYQRLKARAANEGSSAKRLILRGVEQVLREKRTASREQRQLRTKSPVSFSTRSESPRHGRGSSIGWAQDKFRPATTRGEARSIAGSGCATR